MSFKLNIKKIKKKNWAKKSANIIGNELDKIKNGGNIFVAGGKTLKKIYPNIKNKCLTKKNLNFFLTDDRLVSYTSKFSNYKTIKEKISRLNKFYFVKKNIYSINPKYKNTILPDLTILSLGADGHIASLFSSKYKYLKKNYQKTSKKGENFKRISITPHLLKKSKKMICFAIGYKKTDLFYRICKNKKLFNYYPAKYAKKALWVTT